MTRRGRGKRRSADLEPEDERLWRHVTRSVKPIDSNRALMASLMESTTAARGPTTPRKPTPETVPKTTSRQKTDGMQKSFWTADSYSRTTGSQGSAPSAPLETPANRQWARRLAKGDMPIDARLDLHGLTQAEAHGRLMRFLQIAVAQKLRVLLVITGKGGKRGTRGGSDQGGAGHHDAPGVLRRSLRGWIKGSAVSGQVMSVHAAHHRHGGSGAWYVVLRRPDLPNRGDT